MPNAAAFSSGTLWDPSGCFAAPYTGAGESDGGQCMALKLLYLCPDTVFIDELVVTLSAGFVVTNSWPAVAYQQADGATQLHVAIPGYMASVDHNESETFTVCTKPLSKPVGLQVVDLP